MLRPPTCALQSANRLIPAGVADSVVTTIAGSGDAALGTALSTLRLAGARTTRLTDRTDYALRVPRYLAVNGEVAERYRVSKSHLNRVVWGCAPGSSRRCAVSTIT